MQLIRVLLDNHLTGTEHVMRRGKVTPQQRHADVHLDVEVARWRHEDTDDGFLDKDAVLGEADDELSTSVAVDCYQPQTDQLKDVIETKLNEIVEDCFVKTISW